MTKTCNDKLVFGDDYGDNDVTFSCQRVRGHDGMHTESGQHEGRLYLIYWVDARTPLEKAKSFCDVVSQHIEYAACEAIYRVKRFLRRGT